MFYKVKFMVRFDIQCVMQVCILVCISFYQVTESSLDVVYWGPLDKLSWKIGGNNLWILFNGAAKVYPEKTKKKHLLHVTSTVVFLIDH